MKKLYTLLSVLALLSVFTASAQLTVTENPTTEELTTFFEGADVAISNLSTVNCAERAHGFFSGGTGPLELIPQGYVITTGRANNIIGPNNVGNRSTNNVLSGDLSLTALAGTNTFDASIIEFDIIPQHNMILFDYSFGSEEYPEYVGLFNDVFTVFASGEGIEQEQNFALVPGTDLPVNVTNISNGYAQSGDTALGPCVNCEYYIENIGGEELQYDALTTVLTGVIHVVPQTTYHIKIAIADALDRIYDTGVFFTWYSFRSVQDITTSIDANADREITVFPNPNNGTFTVETNLTTNGLIKTEIRNLFGQLVYAQDENAAKGIYRKSIDMELANGIYLITLQTNEGRVTKKIEVVK